jgi:serine/threonine protein kinase
MPELTHIGPRRLPESIGKYKITRELGRGASSHVYMGVDPETFKLVAIKKIRTDTNFEMQKKMFEVEASLIGKIHHPNIVDMYEAQTNDPRNIYIVMEYIDGTSLDKFSTPDSLLPLEKVLDIIRQSAEALNYACEKGIIHRDVKPANILLRQDWLAKLTDFGCALVFNSDTTQIRIAGSLSYMSPEQLQGQTLNQQSDIYSLGAVLYRLLTGKSPYNATDQDELFNQIISQPHVPIDQYRAGLPLELSSIINRALHKEKEDRYPNWIEFLSELDSCARRINSENKFDDRQKFLLMKKCPFFENFTPVAIWEVLRTAQWRNFSPNEELMKEDEHGFSLFILLEGTALITKKHRVLNSVLTGDCIGESSCLHQANPIRNATVTAQNQVITMEIPKERLERLSKDVSLSMDRALMRSLNNKLNESNARILQLMGV